MDIDRYIARNQPTWDRLAVLTAQARRGVRRVPPDQVDELVQLYQRVSAHLSHARTYYGDSSLTLRLTALVAGAGGVIYGKRARTARAIGRFFTTTFPAAVWDSRRFVAVSGALLFVPAILVGAWLANSDAALEASAPDAVREAYVQEDFESYYSSAPAGQFATQVTVNNIQVAFIAFGAGILLCVGTAYILVTNGASLGQAAGLFAAAGEQARFYGLILPHGLLELTAVAIAGAAGLRLGWVVIAPGDRTRGDALADEGRRSVVITLGLVLAFMLAGTIEGFITGSGLPTSLRVGVGIAVEVAFITYVVVRGRAAAAHGLTGRLDEQPDQSRPVAFTLR